MSLVHSKIMKLWEIETDQYVPRITGSLDLLRPALDVSQRLPVAPFSVALSTEQTIAFHLAMFGRNGAIVDLLTSPAKGCRHV